jgi:ATP-dependent DNA helicase RecQ
VLLSGEQVKSIIALKKWRADQAAQENVPLYMVAQNKWLEDIVRLPVRSLDDLTRVRGLGEWRVQKYGPKIIEVLNAENAGRRAWPASSHSAANA